MTLNVLEKDAFTRRVPVLFPNKISVGYEIRSVENREIDNGVHHYVVTAKDKDGRPEFLNFISFQDAPLTGENARHNGLLSTTLIGILIDHLTQFQGGKLVDQDTQRAIESLKDAYFYLSQRSVKREMRGVLGTHQE